MNILVHVSLCKSCSGTVVLQGGGIASLVILEFMRAYLVIIVILEAHRGLQSRAGDARFRSA